MGGPLGHTQYLWSPQTPPISGSVDSKPRPSFPFLQPRRVQTQCLHPAVPAGDPEQDRTLFPRLDSNSRPTGPVRPCQVRPGSPCQCLPRNASSQPRTRLHVPCISFPAPPTTSPTRRVSARPPDSGHSPAPPLDRTPQRQPCKLPARARRQRRRP